MKCGIKHLVMLVVLVIAAVKAEAQDFGLTLGFRSTNVDSVVAGTSTTGETGLQGGALAWIPISEQFYFRGGFLFTQKYFSADQAGGAVDVKFSYLDLPATVMWRFSDFGGVFFGPVLSINQSKSCSDSSTSNCTVAGTKSNLLPIQFGASFKFAPQLGGELVYEFYSGKISDDFENMRSIGANFVVWFE